MTDDRSITDQHSRRIVALALGVISIVLCLPAILGVIGTLGPPLLTGPKMPLETAWDRALVGVFTWSALIAMFSPPFTLVAAPFAIWSAAWAGLHSRFGRTVLIILAVAILLSVVFAIYSYVLMSRFRSVL